MTLQDAKNQVARIYKYSNWNQMELDLKKELLQDWVISRLHEAAGLYANSQNKELREEVERLKAENDKNAIDFARWIATHEFKHEEDFYDQIVLIDSDWYWETDKDGDNPISEEKLYEWYNKALTTP